MLKRLRRSVVFLVGTLGSVSLLIGGCVSAGGSSATGAAAGSTADSAVRPPPDCGQPAEGDTIVVLASGTANEPRPSLTPQAEQVLRDAAESGDVSDGRNGSGSVAVVTSADTGSGGQPAEVLPLTPRRANCEVEHGFQRDNLIDTNIARVRNAVAGRAAVRPGLDLLAGIDNAVRGYSPGTLVIASNGLSTAGGFDLRQVGWNANPADLVTQLAQRGLLQNLLPRWHVLFTGLGATAGAQPPLTKPARDTLVGYWTAICTAAAPGGSCDVDARPLDPSPPVATADMPVVDVPGIDSATGPDGRTTVTLFDSVTGFAPDSAVLSADAQNILRGISARIAAKLAQQPHTTITIRGYVADPPGSTPASRQQTADERARAVEAFLTDQLRAAGFSPPIDAAGAGTPPQPPTAIVNGAFDGATAAQMRKVTITY
jgi:outer membrane protein OmpA-like peptidoglycan-associated protein